MASFSTAYGLCSITDSRSLLGVTEDDEGCAVVTLGKSMVIRCRLSDQKQLNSWSSALAKLTSKVVWNAIDETYVGVFDDVYVKQWTKQDPSLEKAQKHKFKNEIHEIFSFSRQNILKKPQLVIIFKNGSVRDLHSGLSNSKEPMKDVILPQEVIELADIVTHDDNKYLIIVTKFENKYRQCYSVLLQEDSFTVTDSVKKIKLRRQGSSLLGFNILAGAKGNSLLTFWSDSFFYSLPLPLESRNTTDVGKYLGAINVISRNFEVGIHPVNGDHVAIYGADPSEEGAFLGIYNVKFGVIQARTSFKMLNKPPRMWLIDDNLIIVMGQRLVCVPFNLQTETLSGLVGSRALHADRKTPSEICTLIPTAVWNEDGKPEVGKVPENYPEKIREQLVTFASEGWSEFGICQALMTHLIDAKDVNTMLWCLNNFTDIPEDHLVRMIQMAFRNDSEDAFKASVGEDLPETDVKSQFINRILTVPVDAPNLRKNLRELLTFEDCLLLVGYLNELLSEEGRHGDVSIQDSSNVLEWTATLVDAFYQQLILSKDSTILESVILLKKRVEENILCLKNLIKLIPVVKRLITGKGLGRGPPCRASYYLERLQLYLKRMCRDTRESVTGSTFEKRVYRVPTPERLEKEENKQKGIRTALQTHKWADLASKRAQGYLNY